VPAASDADEIVFAEGEGLPESGVKLGACDEFAAVADNGLNSTSTQ
jgi:hypothetical protein